MSASLRKRFLVSAETADPYDALSRLLADGQRFGIGLVSIRAQSRGDGLLDIEMIVIAGEEGPDALERRLSRHPSIADLAIRPEAAEPACNGVS